MSQALHIFRKDVRCLRVEIGMFALLSALLAAGLSGPLSTAVQALLIVGAIHLASRVVHAEPIPGTSQFWITRPYNWRSLLVAKLLFLAVCIDVPILLARLISLTAQGYPLGESLVPLLWSQILMFGAMLPVAALASMTAGIMEFTIGMLALAVAYLLQFIAQPLTVRLGHMWPTSTEWLRNSIVLTLFIALAAAVLWWQYRDRRTGFTRLFSVGAGVAAVALYVAIPPSAGLAVETWLSRDQGAAERIVPDTARKSALTLHSAQDIATGSVRVPFAIQVANLPPNTEMVVDGWNVSVDWPDGAHYTGPAGVGGVDNKPGYVSVFGTVALPGNFYRRIGEPARIAGSLYFTLFGDPKSKTIPYANHPVNALDGLQCFNGVNSQVRGFNPVTGAQDSNLDFSSYYCRGFFGWPSRLVYAKTADLESAFTRLVSYSPFPSGLELDSNEARYTSLILAERSGTAAPIHEVTIVSEKPLAHLRRDFAFPSLRLADFIRDYDFVLPRRVRPAAR